MAKKTTTTKACPTEKEQWSVTRRDIETATRAAVLARLPLDRENRKCNTNFQDCYVVFDVEAKPVAQTDARWRIKILNRFRTRTSAESYARKMRPERDHAIMVLSADAYNDIDGEKFAYTKLGLQTAQELREDLTPKEMRYLKPRETLSRTPGEIEASFFSHFDPQILRTKNCPTTKEQFVYQVSRRQRAKTTRIAKEVDERIAAQKSVAHLRRLDPSVDWCNEKESSNLCYAVVAYSEIEKKAILLGRFSTDAPAQERARDIQTMLWKRAFQRKKEEPYLVQVMPIEFFYKLPVTKEGYEIYEASIGFLPEL